VPIARTARLNTMSEEPSGNARSQGATKRRIDGARGVLPTPYASPVIVGQATTTVTVPPSEVFEFVLDLHRYREADLKIGRVGPTSRSGDSGTVRFSGRIKGLPGPSGTYPFTVSASRLQFGSPIAGPARWFLDFEGTFDCETTGSGTLVTHRETFNFRRPWRWIAEPLLRRWLEADTVDEMVRFKELVEQRPAASHDQQQ
jgi:hypothetical protein